MGLLYQRSLILGFLLGSLFVHAFCHELGFQFLHLLAVVLVESHIEVTDEVVALHAACLWSNAVAPLLPCEHRLADVDTTVVHDICLHHLVAVCRHDLRQRPSEQVVAHMTQV